eukprot:TRINITY_DN2603_c0_g1_i1.p1 TRINITY_DN2603_c0_g1~~TRINITY_DN2603_c0_g1_i1.p1  ORF type:complete len:305 (+),score=67.12 TRINITY_DN2603_c0_g1_i1:137-1051(+)
MATIPGGGTIDTIGTTDLENQTLTTILTTDFSTAPVTKVGVDIGNSQKADVVPNATTIGTFDVLSATNTILTATTPGEVVVANVTGAATGSVNNVVVDSNAGGVFVQGTSAGSITAVIAADNSKTTLVVGDAGTQFIDMSRSTANTTIVSGVGNDSVVGGFGNDQVQLGEFGMANGGGGADTLIGGLGSATLGGGGGSDSIVASSGGSFLIGESGNDTMVGGAGKDVFIYTSNGGNDVISGFDPTQDTLGLANFADIAAAGQGLIDIINGATVSGGNTILTMPDGSTITVAGVTGINISWFTNK